jgi:hypothetical protein
VTQILFNDKPSHGSDRKTFEMMTSTEPLGTRGSMAPLLSATLREGNHDRNRKQLCNIGYSPYADAAGMVLQINGKFTVRTFRSYLMFRS